VYLSGLSNTEKRAVFICVGMVSYGLIALTTAKKGVIRSVNRMLFVMATLAAFHSSHEVIG